MDTSGEPRGQSYEPTSQVLPRAEGGGRPPTRQVTHSSQVLPTNLGARPSVTGRQLVQEDGGGPANEEIVRRRDGDVNPAALAAAARGSGDAAARCLREGPLEGSDRPGVHGARNIECKSIEQEAACVEMAERNLEPCRVEGDACRWRDEAVGEYGNGDREQYGKQSGRGDKRTCSAEEELGAEGSSHRQARLRRRRGPSYDRKPIADGPTGDDCSSGRSHTESSLSRGAELIWSGSKIDSINSRATDARLAAPPRGRRAEHLAADGVGGALDSATAAAGAISGTRWAHGSWAGDDALELEDASRDRRAQGSQKQRPLAGERIENEGEDGRASAGPQVLTKRRRIRGKQPPRPIVEPSWTTAYGAAALGDNSVHEAGSACPSRSAHSYVDRRAACGDRHGQALGPCSGASDGAGGARDAAVEEGRKKWSTWRGRPPDAD